MLFNSYVFLFIFLPIVLLGFHLIGKKGHYRLAISWLVFASLFFYGWWNPVYILLILGSTLFNFFFGFLLLKQRNKLFLILGIMGNLAVLGYFKYANFFVANINHLSGSNIVLEQIILPLGISFFTFQQITFLVDTFLGKTKEYNFLQYFLFVTFFPQLIAGPIVHHKKMMPQFEKNVLSFIKGKKLASGFTIFVIGLFKKVVLADNIATYVTPVFKVAEYGVNLTFFEAWGGSLAYTFQLYFDFSGYSDMAIGLGLMFGIILPVNFLSPYKTKNIVEFWRHWHITLSNLVRDYLYYPLALLLNRYSINRNYNAFFTFNLGIIIPTIFSFFWVGLWHGAGWNFIFFGLLHGFYIVIYNFWIKIKKNCFGLEKIISSKIFAQILTFIAVTISFVFFRAENTDSAINILSSMLGINSISLPHFLFNYFGDFAYHLTNYGILFDGMLHNGVFGQSQWGGFIWIILLFLICTFMPNTQQIMRRENPEFEMWTGKVSKPNYKWMVWKPNLYWLIFTTTLFIFALLNMSRRSEFLYFQF